MKISPFTLVYHPGPRSRARGATAARGSAASSARPRPPEASPPTADAWAKKLDGFKPALKETLRRSVAVQTAGAPPAASGMTADQRLEQVVKDLRRSSTVKTIGVWDVDARIPDLDDLLPALNHAQPQLTFFALEAPVPSGLVIQPEAARGWALRRFGQRLSKGDLEELLSNLMFDDYARFARRVQRSVGVDYLIGLTRHRVAFVEDGTPYWNYFTCHEGRLSLISTYDVRDYAARAGRPFAAAVGLMVVTEALVLIQKGLGYHEEDRGCLFDFNRDRASIVDGLKQAAFEPGCLDRIKPPYREAAAALTRVLREQVVTAKAADPPRPGAARRRGPGKQETAPAAGADDTDWLAKLSKIAREHRKE